MKRFKFFQKLIFFLNILAAIGLLLSYVSPYVRPSDFLPIAFFGLALPYFFLLNILFLIIWVIFGNMRFFLPLIFLILGYKELPKYLQLNFNPPSQEEGIKIMSFNVRLFDLYLWTEEKTTRNKIFEFLDKEQPDILCLQEFYHPNIPDPNYEFTTLDTLKKFLKAKNYYFYVANIRPNSNNPLKSHYGLITFSKFPILEKGVVEFKEKGDNACIYTDLKIGSQKFRVFNAHLESIKLNKYDYKALQKVNNNEYSKDFEDEIMVIDKLQRGFKVRESQADSIKKSIHESPYPVILCGDFNDTPSSYAYREIRSNLKDAFIESGSGLGLTYIWDYPSFRIDYILYDDRLSSEQFQTHKEKLSDHHPISVLLYPN